MSYWSPWSALGCASPHSSRKTHGSLQKNRSFYHCKKGWIMHDTSLHTSIPSLYDITSRVEKYRHSLFSHPLLTGACCCVHAHITCNNMIKLGRAYTFLTSLAQSSNQVGQCIYNARSGATTSHQPSFPIPTMDLSESFVPPDLFPASSLMSGISPGELYRVRCIPFRA